MQPLVELLDALKVQFADDQSAIAAIEDEIWELEEWIEENPPEEV